MTAIVDIFAGIDHADLEWQKGAVCAQVDPELFFPEKGQTSKVAKAICASCDVRQQCLEYALETGQVFGVWGGLGEAERRRVRVAQDGPVRHLPSPRQLTAEISDEARQLRRRRAAKKENAA